MEFEYKEVPEKDKLAVFELIDLVISSLDDPSCFIPYEDWEYERMFDKSYAYLHGAYVDGKLVGIAQLYVEEKMLTDARKMLKLYDCKLAELGGNLVDPKYRHYGITTTLIRLQIDLAKRLGFECVVAYTHPENKAMNRVLAKLGMKYIDHSIICDIYPRNCYLLTNSI